MYIVWRMELINQSHAQCVPYTHDTIDANAERFVFQWSPRKPIPHINTSENQLRKLQTNSKGKFLNHVTEARDWPNPKLQQQSHLV